MNYQHPSPMTNPVDLACTINVNVPSTKIIINTNNNGIDNRNDTNTINVNDDENVYDDDDEEDDDEEEEDDDNDYDA